MTGCYEVNERGIITPPSLSREKVEPTNPDDDAGFDVSRAELFEALGHPSRIRLLQALSERPLSFSELKKETGIQSSGLLSFHLGKLTHLATATKEGSYTLTDQGREAMRIVRITRSEGIETAVRVRTPGKGRYLATIVILLLAVASLSSIAAYQAYRPTVPGTVTTTSISVSTISITFTSSLVSSVSSSSTALAVCTILGPTDGVVIRVVMNNGSNSGHTVPVAGAQVSGEDDGYCNGQKHIMALKTETTNSSGWASLLDGGYGAYNLTVSVSQSVSQSSSAWGISVVFLGGYDLTIPTQPTAITYVTYNISTGGISWSYHYTA